VNKDLEKLKLQNLMAFGTEMVQHSERQSNKYFGDSKRRPSAEIRDRFEECKSIFYKI